ncbi:MAG TPA: efflux transporter outer membrane subunit [Kofleriaceae bacterium]|nr:efflux transporter outer membrane subunit [Kofleriaceae bacterium]
MNRHILLGTLIAAATSCSPHKVTHRPAPPVPVPAAFSGDGTGAPLPDRWWRDFGDPELSRLIDAMFADNLQLRAAWARLRQGAALARQASSGKWPQVDLEASAARAENRINLPSIGQQTFSSNSFQISVRAGYEVDVWNKVASNAAAARLDVAAGRDEIEGLAMSMVAQLSEVWFELVHARAQRKLLNDQLDTNKIYVELTELRFGQGQASALDVYQQQQQVLQIQANLALVEGAIAANQQALAVMLGKPPQTSVAGGPDVLPELPAPPGTGVPADLLVRRPDVRAAQKRVEAADYRVAAAVADRLPGLRLMGALSLSNANIGDLIAAPLYSIMASVTAPLFDGGRRKAEVDRNRAVVEEQLANFGQVLLSAMLEVEQSLVFERQQRLHLIELVQQVEVSGKALREARERYRQGLIDYLPVITALQAQQRTELALLGAQRQLISYRIQLYRALGGSWTGELAAPAALTPASTPTSSRGAP